MPKVHLTDAEWMSLIDRDRGGLPRGDVVKGATGKLRECIVELALGGGKLNWSNGRRFLAAYAEYSELYDVAGLTALANLVEQVRAGLAVIATFRR